jgi:hypothetical protein
MTTFVIDPTRDKTKSELVKIAEHFELPDFVKSANLEATMHPVNIAITAYADPLSQSYPCHTAAATWLSTAYFATKQGSFNNKQQKNIRDRLEKAADYFAIKSACAEIYSAVNRQKAANANDNDFAYVYQTETGEKERHYPITTAEEVKIAAEWLYANQDNFIFDDRNKVAEKIHSRKFETNAQLGEKLAEFIEKQAGYGVPDIEAVHTALSNRALLAKNKDHREKIEKLAAEVDENPALFMCRDSAVKLASVIDQIDYAIGIKGKYGQLLARPEEIVFTVPLQKAASACGEACELQTGNIYTKDQLAKLARQDLIDLFGEDFAKEACVGLQIDPEKLASIAHTLPKPDAELLEKLLKAAGQSPSISKTASSPAPVWATLHAAASY